MSTPQRATAAQVAAHAGVSVASVSRVLNGLKSSVGMAERVQAAAAELGYVPDATARSLKVGRTEQLALAVADVGNPAYVAMMRAVEDVVRAAGYRTVLSGMGADPDDEIDVIRSLARGFADGLILSPLRVTPELVRELEQARRPIVVVGTLPAGTQIDNVRADSPGGVRLAITHLHEGGRRRIGFLNGPADTVPGSARARGYLRTIKRLRLPHRDALTVTAADFTYDAGRAVADQLLDQDEPPDAVLGANDLLAVAMINAITERGGRVPEDIAVVGMDDTEIASYIRPSLTSVSLGSAERGRIAAELLLARIADPGREVQRVTVTPRLTIRSSSDPIGGWQQ
jgi:LacI family transcriptional regulator